jgi:hypothetical protein
MYGPFVADSRLFGDLKRYLKRGLCGWQLWNRAGRQHGIVVLRPCCNEDQRRATTRVRPYEKQKNLRGFENLGGLMEREEKGDQLRDVEFIDLPFIVGAIPAGRPCGNRVISLI